MTILCVLMGLALLVSLFVIYDQRRTINVQRKRLIESLDWIDPAEIVLPEDWRC